MRGLRAPHGPDSFCTEFPKLAESAKLRPPALREGLDLVSRTTDETPPVVPGRATVLAIPKLGDQWDRAAPRTEGSLPEA